MLKFFMLKMSLSILSVLRYLSRVTSLLSYRFSRTTYHIIDPRASIALCWPAMSRMASGTAVLRPCAASGNSSSSSVVGKSFFSSLSVWLYASPSLSRRLVHRQLPGRMALSKRVVDTERFPYRADKKAFMN